MKRTLAILAGLGILSLAGYVGGRVWAQQPGSYPTQGQPIQPTSATQPASPTTGAAPNSAAPLRTRIAVINIAGVLKEYKKAKDIQEYVNAQVKKIDMEELQPIRTRMIQMRDALQKSTDPAERERLERDMRKLQLELQEKEEDARKRMAKLSGDYMVQLYREVEESVKYYGRVSDLDLVLFYFDPTDPQNPYDPLAVQSKLRTGGALPMYVASNMDITATIVKWMNGRLQQPSASAQPATGN